MQKMLLRLLFLFLPPPPVAKLKAGRKLKFKKPHTTSPQSRTPKLAFVHLTADTVDMSGIHSTCIGIKGLRWVREVEYKFL